MARELGITKDIYVNWDTGRTAVPWVYVLRILARWPDEDLRTAIFAAAGLSVGKASFNFPVDIGEPSSRIRSTSRPELPKEQVQGARPRAIRSDERITPRHYKPAPKQP